MPHIEQEGGVSSLEKQLLESGVPEGADCILTEKQFCARYCTILEEPSEEKEEN